VREGTVAIANIDTRKLTRLLRTQGRAERLHRGLAAGEAGHPGPDRQAIAQPKAAPSMAGLDLAKVVSVPSPTSGPRPNGNWAAGLRPWQDAPRFHVVAYDFGVKRNILRMLAERGCKVTVVPAQTPAAEVLKRKPDGIFLSNGPGDPEPCDYAIAAASELIDTGIPTFGICLGHQIMALASGPRPSR
jgi:carbamoyl-phosphate synthase small subunit